MSLGDGFHFAYICISPPQIKPGKYANAGAQVMAEVFIVITSGISTLQLLHRERATATSGGPGARKGGIGWKQKNFKKEKQQCRCRDEDVSHTCCSVLARIVSALTGSGAPEI